MKKLYRKAVVHPTPPVISDHLLYLLPTTLLTLTAALSPEEREVLAYLISCCSSSSSNSSRKIKKTSVDHLPCFDCYCFRCYTSYWVKWDSSPNREVIHEIIDDFEDGLFSEKTKGKKKKRKKNNNKGKVCLEKVELEEVKECEVVEEVFDEAIEAEEEEEEEKGSIRSCPNMDQVERFEGIIPWILKCLEKKETRRKYGRLSSKTPAQTFNRADVYADPEYGTPEPVKKVKTA